MIHTLYFTIEHKYMFDKYTLNIYNNHTLLQHM